MTQTKRCTGRCGRELPADDEHFPRHAHSRDGFRARCIECTAADRRDERLVERLGTADVRNVADAYRKGHREGAAAALRVLEAQGRLRPSDDEAAAQARTERIAALADDALRAKLDGD